MGLRDFNMDWLEKRVFIPAQAFQTYITGAGISDGNPVFQEVNSSGVSGIQINQAADAIATIWHMGSQVDITKQIRFRVWATSSSTDGDAETLSVVYTAINADGTTALADPSTALSTTIPAYTFSTTANVIGLTDFGRIARNTLASTTVGLILKVASTMTNASANEISILGLEIRYTPRLTAGPRRNVLGGRRLLNGYPSGVQLHATQEGL